MSEPSSWPLSNEALRVRVPKHMLGKLMSNDLSNGCFTTAVGYYPQAQSHHMKRIEHDDYIMIYCVDGRGILNAANTRKDVARGDLFILPPGTAHDYQADSEKPWTLFWCHFRGTKAKAFYDHIHIEKAVPSVHHLNDLSLLSRFNDLSDIARSSYSVNGFIHASSQLCQILTLIERVVHGKQRGHTGEILPQIQQHMRANLNQQLTLDDLAQFSHLSKFHFSRKYRALTGFSPLQHFVHLKMEHACFLLEQGQLSISDIAFELGYDDALYFSRVFRKIYHLSPSQFRKELDC